VAIRHGVGTPNSSRLAACRLADLHFYQPQERRLIACDRCSQGALISNFFYISCSCDVESSGGSKQATLGAHGFSVQDEHIPNCRVFYPSTPKLLQLDEGYTSRTMRYENSQGTEFSKYTQPAYTMITSIFYGGTR
jgi:hypothetical protein